jgi:hypothetical protein
MNAPITLHVVYQMGKVGSSSAYESWRRAGIPDLHKVHYLSQEGLDRARRLYAGFHGRVGVPHERSSSELRRMLDAPPGPVRWKVLTLVREPIARDVSAYVQMVDLLSPQLVAGGAPDIARIARGAAAQFLAFDERRSYTCQWFADELQAAFGLDVLARPFDHERGWVHLRCGAVEVAVVRLEDLTRVFGEVSLALTGVRVPLVYASARSADKLQVAYEEGPYRQIVERVRIAEEACRRVYASRYARHFYTDDEIDGFIDKWSRRQPAAAHGGDG